METIATEVHRQEESEETTLNNKYRLETIKTSNSRLSSSSTGSAIQSGTDK